MKLQKLRRVPATKYGGGYCAYHAVKQLALKAMMSFAEPECFVKELPLKHVLTKETAPGQHNDALTNLQLALQLACKFKP
jgi:hypothetical protein